MSAPPPPSVAPGEDYRPAAGTRAIMPDGHPAPDPAGWPGTAREWPPRPPRGTDGFAVAALILAVVGGIPLSILFAIVALVQTRQSGRPGRGLAISALVISGLWLAGIAVVTAVGSQLAGRDDAGRISRGGTISATALTVGDCVNDLTDTRDLRSLPGVPCSQPHDGEVFAVFELRAGPYPGASVVDDQVGRECNARLARYAPEAIEDPSVGHFSVYPLESNWVRGDREVACVATAGGPTTGSLRGS